MNIYFIILIGGILGMLGHTGIKVLDINKRLKTQDIGYVFREYWKHDWLIIIVSALCFFILMFISSEFVNLNQLEAPDNSHSLKERLFNFRLAGFIKTASVIAGYFADSIVYGALGKVEGRIRAGFDALSGNKGEGPKPDIQQDPV